MKRMMKNIKNRVGVAALLLLAGGLLAACTDGDDFKYDKNGLLVTGTEDTPVQSFVVEDTPSSYGITVQSTRKVDKDVHVTVAVDTSLVAAYNAANGTNFYPIPLSCVRLESPNLTIPAGAALSTATSVSVTSTEDFVEGRTYLIPVTITDAEGGTTDVIEASRTLYLRISRVLNFGSLETNMNASSNFIFDDALEHDLSAYTIEFKFYSYGFGNVGDIKRVLAVEGKGEEEANMFRFGENGSAGGDVLQWILPGGRMFSNTHFQTNRWYLVSCTYDGSTYTMYVDGSADATAQVSGHVTPFQRFELGMSWGGYYSSQFFSGRLAEVRVWDKCLSANEIATGMCSVDPTSDGLVAYWKMNETSGHVFHDATGHGYDMDWSNTSRDTNESGNLTATPQAASYLKWLTDANNKCAQ